MTRTPPAGRARVARRDRHDERQHRLDQRAAAAERATLSISDLRQFTTPAGMVKWDFPTIAGMPQVHFQAAVFDPFAPTPWPLPTTPVETVVRVP